MPERTTYDALFLVAVTYTIVDLVRRFDTWATRRGERPAPRRLRATYVLHESTRQPHAHPMTSAEYTDAMRKGKS